MGISAANDASRWGEVSGQVGFVLNRFNAMIERDGARVEVVSLSEGELRLRYVAGPQGHCEACVLNPDDLAALVGEALAGKVDGVATVVVDA